MKEIPSSINFLNEAHVFCKEVHVKEANSTLLTLQYNCIAKFPLCSVFARIFNRSGATQAVTLDISKVFKRFGMLVFFTNLIISLMEFQVRYLALFLLFSVIDDFGWFWMGNLCKNIQLMLEFLKRPFLVLHFS